MMFPWPQVDLAMILTGVRLLMVILVATALVWLLFGVGLKGIWGRTSAIGERGRATDD
jgi:hypothetical protein